MWPFNSALHLGIILRWYQDIHFLTMHWISMYIITNKNRVDFQFLVRLFFSFFVELLIGLFQKTSPRNRLGSRQNSTWTEESSCASLCRATTLLARSVNFNDDFFSLPTRGCLIALDYEAMNGPLMFACTWSATFLWLRKNLVNAESSKLHECLAKIRFCLGLIIIGFDVPFYWPKNGG